MLKNKNNVYLKRVMIIAFQDINNIMKYIKHKDVYIILFYFQQMKLYTLFLIKHTVRN